MITRDELLRSTPAGAAPDYAIAINVGRRAQARGVRQALRTLGRMLRRGGNGRD